MMFDNPSSLTLEIIVIIYIIDFLIACWIVFLERKTPTATIAWIMILLIFPVGGIIMYFLLTQHLSRRKVFALTGAEAAELEESLEEQVASMKTGDFVFRNPEARKWRDMIAFHQIYSHSYYTEDNNVELISDGKEKLDRMIDDIASARKTVNILYFIIKRDETGRRLIEALTAKAKEGVEVRLLIDAVGSRGIFHSTLREFKNAGGKYAYFFPARFKIFNFRLNFRNHRKIVVIDGSVGYIGGFNIGNEYLGLKKKFGYWRDTHIRVTGSSVQDMNARFMMDWRAASKENLELTDAYNTMPIDMGDTGIQIVSSGPDSIKEEVKRGYMRMITSAKKNIYIQTPYFVPDASILESLKMAAQSGIDVRVMIPSIADHMFVYWATRDHAGELLRSGGRIYMYKNGFIHAKTIVVDSEIGSVGSANFDCRSFRLNFESNAFIYGSKNALQMERLFRKDIGDCEELTLEKYNNRGKFIFFRESISRLFSDLL